MGIYLTRMSNSADVNEVFGQRVRDPYPAKSVIGSAELPLGAAVEMDSIARRARCKGGTRSHPAMGTGHSRSAECPSVILSLDVAAKGGPFGYVAREMSSC